MSVPTEMSAKKPYVSPELTVHGDLRALTQGGSAGASETRSGGTGKNCGPNMAKKC